MVVLKNIDVLSAARMAAVIYAILGLVIGILAFLFAGTLATLFGASALRVAGIGALIIIIVPIALLIFGFIVAAIEAWLYNLISAKVGGVKIDLIKNQLKHIDLMSAGKVVAVIGAILGAIAGAIVLIAGLIAGSASIALIGAVGIVGFAILFALIFFIGTAVSIFIYNIVAARFGGIPLYFKGKDLKSIGVLQFAKIEAILGFIGGVIGSVFRALAYLSPSHYMSMALGPGATIAMIILLPFGYAIAGFVVAIIESSLYNYLATKIGAVKITLV